MEREKAEDSKIRELEKVKYREASFSFIWEQVQGW